MGVTETLIKDEREKVRNKLNQAQTTYEGKCFKMIEGRRKEMGCTGITE